MAITTENFQKILNGKDIKEIIQVIMFPDAQRIVTNQFSRITLEDDLLYCYRVNRFKKEELIAVYDFTQVHGLLLYNKNGISELDEQLKSSYFSGVVN